jgi:hypothetical protein
MLLLFVLFGVIAGYFAGFLGVGAGVTLMPIYGFMGIPYNTAIDASLMAVFASSFTGSIQHYKDSGFDMEPCLVGGLMGVVFAAIGNLYLIHLIPATALQVVFIILMFLNVDLLRLCDFDKSDSATEITKETHKKNFFYYIVIGILSGLMASLLGIGGGLILVTLFILWCDFPIKVAVKNAVVIMLLTTLSSLLSELLHNTLPWNIGVPSAIGAVIGGFLGTIALKYVKTSMIKRTNYVISFGLGIIMIIKLVFMP